MDLSQLFIVAINSLGIFLLLLSYVYIDKLEKIGCACAESKYKKFVKQFSLFAAVYLLATMFISPEALVKNFGLPGVVIYGLIHFVIKIAFLVFFVLAFLYIRKLINDKCKCSEDVRREVLYIYYILEIIMLSLSITIGVMLSVVAGAVGIALAPVKSFDKGGESIDDIVRNPVKSIKNIPKDFKKVTSSLKKTLKGRK
jgi:hypothetical protein